jgi:predicted protein tyrosine phosphatase
MITTIENIWPMSRRAALNYLPVDYMLPAIMIQISGTGVFILPRYTEKYTDILQCTFGDSTPSETWTGKLRGGKLFSASDASIIKEFITNYQTSVKTVIIHCNAGISRSPAVALALAEWLDLHKVIHQIAFSFNYFPNPHILLRCREVFGTIKKLREQYAEVFGKPVDPNLV